MSSMTDKAEAAALVPKKFGIKSASAGMSAFGPHKFSCVLCTGCLAS